MPAACGGEAEAPLSTTAATATTVPATVSSTVATIASQAPREPERVVSYRVGIFSDPTTDNPWAVLDTEAEIWNVYVNPSQGGLYTYIGPTYTLAPLLAADAEPPRPAPDGDGWSVTVRLRSDVRWSDGSAKTAQDIAFTFATLLKYDGLGGNFPALWPLARSDDPDTEEDESTEGVSGVTALDDTTVEITFNFEPGIAVWPFKVGLAPVFQEAYWGPIVDASPDAETLYSVSGLGSPNGSAFNSAEREPGAFWRNEAITGYWDRGSRYTVYGWGSVEYLPVSGRLEVWGGTPDGEVRAEYESGPYVSEVIYSVYTDQNSAVPALVEGEVDLILSPLGLRRGLQAEVLAAPDLEVVVNQSNGFRYLAFNTRKFPMSERPFRRAIACLIDKEFMADTVLAGSAIPLDALVPPGNVYWFNSGIEAACAGEDQQGRLESAVDILKEAGWTWETDPAWDEAAGDVVPKGAGLRGPSGRTVPPLTLLAPGPGYDPMRATYSLFVEEWATDLGVPLAAEPTGFSVIVDKILAVDPLGWYMYILGWGLAPFPDDVFELFISSADSAEGRFNTTGYSNPEFDELSERFWRAGSLEEARDLLHQGEALIARDLPYVVLFTAPLIEAYRSGLTFPYTTVLSGLQGYGGLPGLVAFD